MNSVSTTHSLTGGRMRSMRRRQELLQRLRHDGGERAARGSGMRTDPTMSGTGNLMVNTPLGAGTATCPSVPARAR